MAKFQHICEVCGKNELLESEEAFQAGWDYPPRMAPFGVIAPRTCSNCLVNETVWWAIVVDKKKPEELTSNQIATIERISAEPESILPKEVR